VGRWRALVVAAVAAALTAGWAGADDVLRFETDDWILTAPAALGTLADLELNARGTQICHDEIEGVIGHRPTNVAKFTMTWQIGGGPISYATTTGVVSLVPSASGWPLSDPATFPFRSRLVRDGICFGPHEVTHVLTWESHGPLWPNEGFATFTDRMYDSTTWRCCAEPLRTTFSCDETGYTYGPERRAYRDLSPFTIDTVSYHTAACYWWEIHRLGGLPAIRGVLASMRRERPRSDGQVVEHANLVLNTELRPVLARYGFTPAELEAAPPTRSGLTCTLIGSDAADTIAGTAGIDLVCGLAGTDSLGGGDGDDRLDGGNDGDRLAGDAGADTLIGAGGPDSASGGPGNDRLEGGMDNDRLGGDQGADTVLAGAGTDVLFGGGDNDRLDGGLGNDRLSGDAGTDTLLAGAGADVLTGGAGGDRLDGGAGADLLEARDGRRDVVIGGPGRDRARVDRGLDRVVGVEVLLR
jgi:hypothetical protein